MCLIKYVFKSANKCSDSDTHSSQQQLQQKKHVCMLTRYSSHPSRPPWCEGRWGTWRGRRHGQTGVQYGGAVPLQRLLGDGADAEELFDGLRRSVQRIRALQHMGAEYCVAGNSNSLVSRETGAQNIRVKFGM